MVGQFDVKRARVAGRAGWSHGGWNDDRDSVGFDKELHRKEGVNAGVLLRTNVHRHLLETEAGVHVRLNHDVEPCGTSWLGKQAVLGIETRPRGSGVVGRPTLWQSLEPRDENLRDVPRVDDVQRNAPPLTRNGSVGGDALGGHVEFIGTNLLLVHKYNVVNEESNVRSRCVGCEFKFELRRCVKQIIRHRYER